MAVEETELKLSQYLNFPLLYEKIKFITSSRAVSLILCSEALGARAAPQQWSLSPGASQWSFIHQRPTLLEGAAPCSRVVSRFGPLQSWFSLYIYSSAKTDDSNLLALIDCLLLGGKGQRVPTNWTNFICAHWKWILRAADSWSENRIAKKGLK